MSCSFISAGAEVVVTASYQASVAGFQEHTGVSEDDAINLIKLSAKLAQEARTELHKDSEHNNWLLSLDLHEYCLKARYHNLNCNGSAWIDPPSCNFYALRMEFEDILFSSCLFVGKQK